ncbi:hypothetical protein SBADM41S_10798 [Streptomyces badius]
MTRHGPLNEFCWMDLKTRDPSGTAAFFSAVLGWDFAVDEEDWRRAVTISAGDHRIGGVSDLAGPAYPPDLPAHVAYYLAVDDVDRRTAVAAENGARILVPPFDAGDQGRIATLIDPEGAAVSFHSPGDRPAPDGEPDALVAGGAGERHPQPADAVRARSVSGTPGVRGPGRRGSARSLAVLAGGGPPTRPPSTAAAARRAGPAPGPCRTPCTPARW